jgi:phytoene dehydrogenase-like protein
MAETQEYDAVIIGSGPNGLAAGISLARQNLSVKIIEAKETIGGGTRTQELTEPGFLHDVCSAVHPTGIGSPYLKTLPLSDYGLEWIHPVYPVAHPLDNDAVILSKDVVETADSLGRDGRDYLKLFQAFSEKWDNLSQDLFSPLRIPNYPFDMMKFGWYGIFPSTVLSNALFKEERTKALFAGMAAHSILPLDKAFTASFGMILGITAHAVGWPVAKGGSHSITNAMAKYFLSLGGEIQTSTLVDSLDQLPNNKVTLFDLTPHQIAKIAEGSIPNKYKNKLLKYRYGPGSFKIDFALNEPVPWNDEQVSKAGTVHLGGTLEEIAFSEKEVWNGKLSENPYVLVSQPSLFDSSRAPDGKHTLWAYCHTPSDSEADCTELIINQIERYASGFRDVISSYSVMTAKEMEVYNPNYIGGDINGGAQTFKQLVGRPVFKWDPYKIPDTSMYICSSSTPPGGGVHGMCGYHAAQSVIKNEFS